MGFLLRYLFYLTLGLITFCYSPASHSWAQGSLEEDWKALVALYNATGGANWENNDNWSADLTTQPTPAELESWYGVELVGGRVTRLGLVNNNLSGTIPSSLGSISQLEELLLHGNSLTGEIPSSLGSLSELKALSLASNSLTGPIPSSLGNLSQLEDLFLRYNSLSGPIPSSLGNLSELKVLALDSNSLTGTIPGSLGNLSQLESLVLQYNSLSGTIPGSLSNLSRLEKLYLGSNGLSGTVPGSLGNLSTLKELYLDVNSLTGELPGSLTNLRLLIRIRWVENNGLCAPTDNDFQVWLADVRRRGMATGPNCAPEISIGDETVLEDAGPASLRVSLHSVPNEAVAVRYATSDGTATSGQDYRSASGTLTIPAGVTEAHITVDILNDLTVEPEETFTVTLTDPVGASLSRATATVTIIDEDLPVVSINDVVVTEDVGRAVFAVRLDTPFSVPVTVSYATVDGTATAADYVPVSGELTILPGELSVEVAVVVIDDSLFEPDEMFKVVLSSPVSAVLGDGVGEGTIRDNDQYELSVNDVTVEEAAGEARFTVSLDRPNPEQTIRVAYSTADGTATATADYVPISGELTIPPGELSVEVAVVVIDDGLFEPDETFTVVLSSPVSAVLGDGIGEGTIRDNDQYELSIDDVTVGEAAGEARFRVSLDRPNLAQTAWVAYATVDGTATAGLDYEARTEVLVFSPGESERMIVVSLLDDEIDEPDETFHVTLSRPRNAVIARGEATGTIVDDEATPVLSIGDVTVREDAGSAVFTVRLSGRSAIEVRADYATSDETATGGVDYTETSGTVQFSSGEVERRIVVPVLEDDLEEPSETFLVRLSGVVNAEIDDGVGRGTITDNDEPLTISIDDARALEDVGVVHLPVRLSRPSSAVVSVLFASSDVTAESGLDYTASRGIVVFESGSMKGVVVIGVEEDALNEEDETFHVTLSRPKNAAIARGVATGTIGDNDGTPHLWVDDILVREDREEAVFTVRLSLPSTRLVTASYRTIDGTATAGADYEETSGTVAFAPGEVQKEVGVQLLRGKRDWREETFTLSLTSVSNARLEDADAKATIVQTETVESGVLTAYLARFARTSSGHVLEAMGERLQKVAPVCVPVAEDRLQMARMANRHWEPSVGELLAGCGLRIGSATRRGAFSVWGRGAFTRFNGREGMLSLQSDVTTASFGADYRWDSGLLAGLLLSHSGATGTYAAYALEGETGSSLTGVYPYVSYRLPSSDLWVLAGLGWGSVEVSGAERVEADLDASLMAAGASGTLAESGAVRLSYVVDAFVVDAMVEDPTRIRVSRLRAGVEGSVLISRILHPFVEAALRRDGGDAETGLGLEVGGGVRLVPPGGRVRADVRARGLVTHASTGFTEWGVAATLRYRAASGLGPTAELRPVWGSGRSGGIDALWRHTSVADAAIGVSGQPRMELLLGYGLARPTGVRRPVFGVTLRESGREYRLGYEVQLENGLSLSASGTARGNAMPAQSVVYGVSTRATLRW